MNRGFLIMIGRSRFCSALFSLVLLFCLAISADAAYRPMDAIPKARPDTFYIVGEVQDLEEMTTRLSYSFALNRLTSGVDVFKSLPHWLRNLPAQKGAFLLDVDPLTDRRKRIRFNIALSFGDEHAALLKKIERKKATPAEIYSLLFFVDNRLSGDGQVESVDFLGIMAPEGGKGEYRLDNIDMEMTARGNLLLISIESGLGEMTQALSTPSFRHEEKRVLSRGNSVVLQMGETLMKKVRREIKEILPYGAQEGALRFEASVKMRENGWDMRAVTNVSDLFMPSADLAEISRPLEKGAFLSVGGAAPFIASSWNLSPSRIQRAIGEGKLPTTLLYHWVLRKYDNVKNAQGKKQDNPLKDVKNIFSYLEERDPNGNLFKIFNTVSLVAAGGGASDKGTYYLALTKGDAAAVAQLDKDLYSYMQKNNASKRYRRINLQGWDAVYTLNTPDKAGSRELALALRNDQVLVGFIDLGQLSTPLNTSGRMVEDLIANRALSEFIYFDVEALRRLAWDKVFSDGAQKSKMSRRDRFFFSRMLLCFTDFKEIGVETTSARDFNFRFTTGQPSTEEKSRLLFLQ